MRKLTVISLLFVIIASIPANDVNAGAYALLKNTDGVIMEFQDVVTYFPSPWADENVKLAERLGIGYPGRNEKYSRQLTRKELAYVAVNLYRTIDGNASLTLTDEDLNRIGAEYTDSYIKGSLLDDEVFLAIKYNLMYGTSKDKFSPNGLVTREQTAAVLYRLVGRFIDMEDAPRADLSPFSDYDKISDYASDCFSVMVGADVLSGVSADRLAPQNVCTYEEVLSIAVRLLHSFEYDLNVNLYSFYDALIDCPNVVSAHTSEIDYQDDKIDILDADWVAQNSAAGYVIDCTKPDGTVLRTVTTNTGVTIFEADAYEDIEVYTIGSRGGIKAVGIVGEHGASLMNPVETPPEYAGIYVYNDYAALLRVQEAEDEHLYSYSGTGPAGTNPKNITMKRYSSTSDAMADMTEITVRIWKMGPDNTRVSGTTSLTVHSAVAQDIAEVFEDIYNGPEQFPIYSVGGYSWRGAGSKSAHMQGLAIDINPDHNYFINTRGSILAGKMWSPSQSPYSIKPDGDVVRAFNKKGWFWGGIGWASTGKDYMHFSYTGT